MKLLFSAALALLVGCAGPEPDPKPPAPRADFTFYADGSLCFSSVDTFLEDCRAWVCEPECGDTEGRMYPAEGGSNGLAK